MLADDDGIKFVRTVREALEGFLTRKATWIRHDTNNSEKGAARVVGTNQCAIIPIVDNVDMRRKHSVSRYEVILSHTIKQSIKYVIYNL